MTPALLALSVEATGYAVRLQAAGRIAEVWLPGFHSANGYRILSVFPGIITARMDGGDVYRWLPSGIVQVWSEGKLLEADPDEGGIPGRPNFYDFSDPLTATGLILIVREAWEDPLFYIEGNSPGHWGTELEFDHPHPTELHALVAALKAAADRWAPSNPGE